MDELNNNGWPRFQALTSTGKRVEEAAGAAGYDED